MTPTTLSLTTLLLWAAKGTSSSSKSHVTITNNLQTTGKKLFVQCWSKEVNFGTHNIEDGAAYDFTIHVDKSSETDFMCDLAWENGFLEFNAYNTTRDRKRCSKQCRWIANKEFVTGYTRHGKPDIVYHWLNPFPSHLAPPS